MKRTPLRQGCGKRRFDTKLAAEKAAGRGADGKPSECGAHWHLKVTDSRPGFSAEVKLMARIRAGAGDAARAVCEACGTFLGRAGGDIQHRVARGAGGCADAIVNGLSAAALLCRRCHDKAESRDPHMRDDEAGWWIRHGKGSAFDPRLVPVLLYSEGGSGVIRWFSDDEPVYLETQPDLGMAA